MSDSQRIGKALSRIAAPIYLARQENQSGRITIFTPDRKAARLIRDRAGPVLAGAGVSSPVRVVARPVAAMGRHRSLEALARGLAGGSIVYDPTRVVTRAEAIVELGRDIRAAVGRRVTGISLEPDRRTLYVTVDRNAYSGAGADRLTARAETLKAVTGALSRWRSRSPANFDVAVRLGYEAPVDVRLVPVDRATSAALFRRLIRQRFGRSAIRAAAASLLGIGVVVPASAAGPAVSEPNLSVVGFGASYDLGAQGSGSVAGIGAKATIPLGHSFGAQFDAAFGTNEFYGVGGHLFWRDPDQGLLGAIVSYNSLNGTDMYRYGVEGAAYMNNFTLNVKGGAQGGDVSDGLWGKLDITFYATPNFSVSGGIASDPDKTVGTIGFEWQPALTAMPGMSVFADGQIGSKSWQVFAGLRFHFGPSKTLIDRDRRDDPLDLSLVVPSKY